MNVQINLFVKFDYRFKIIKAWSLVGDEVLIETINLNQTKRDRYCLDMVVTNFSCHIIGCKVVG